MASNNLPVVTVNEFVNIIKQQIVEGNKRPIFGLGKGGIGKTEAIRDLAVKELKIGYIDIRLLLYNEVDLKGIPYPNENKTATIWLQNNVLPKEEVDGEQGILVLDEITSVARSVRTAAYQLLNERQLGEYKLPDGWLVVCLGNGEEDGGDFQGTEGNFANRCSVYNVIPSVDIWKEWAYKNNVNPLVTAFVSWMPDKIHTYDDNEATTNLLFASPRSWKAVSDILNCYPNVDFNSEDSKIIRLRIMGNLGTVVGAQFITFAKLQDSELDYNGILNGTVKPNFNNSIEKIYIAIQGVLKLVGDTVELDFSSSGSVTSNTLIKVSNVIKWILTLNRLEDKVLGISDLMKTLDKVKPGASIKIILNPEFSRVCPEIVTFASENTEIFK